MECIITGCNECPYQYDYQGCYHPYWKQKEFRDVVSESDEDVIDFIDGGFPQWCPLKKESITIKLKQD